MVFSSLVFLFAFLPATFVAYYVAIPRHRNIVLLVASLGFYFWGEAAFVLLMVASIVANYLFGLAIERRVAVRGRDKTKVLIALAVALNLAPLVFFKYTSFIVESIRELIGPSFFSAFGSSDIHLPIGISFFSFQAISYVVDVYRGVVPASRNIINLGVYVALFPQLIAGPIVRYSEIARQLAVRSFDAVDFSEGVYRFLVGLVKKVLIANTMGQFADHVFSLPPGELSASVAWLGIIAYTLQIYFDFSGYSDMAIGLGRCFGFTFPENFNYPYIAKSITEFWHRWHMTLSRWFRDYLYIPLGGNRHGAARTYFNLLAVFVLCGLWHGASATFIVWGLFHGAFLVLERSGPGRFVEKLPALMRHVYVLLVVMVGWVFFRTETLTDALAYLQAMVSFGRPPYLDVLTFAYSNTDFNIAAIAGVLFSAPIVPWISQRLQEARGKSRIVASSISLGATVALGALMTYSVAALVASGYNPFLYFRF